MHCSNRSNKAAAYDYNETTKLSAAEPRKAKGGACAATAAPPPSRGAGAADMLAVVDHDRPAHRRVTEAGTDGEGEGGGGVGGGGGGGEV